MRRRRETVEHPFGTMKARMGATHFLTKTKYRLATELADTFKAIPVVRGGELIVCPFSQGLFSSLPMPRPTAKLVVSLQRRADRLQVASRPAKSRWIAQHQRADQKHSSQES